MTNLTGKHHIRAFDYNTAAWKKWNDVDGAWIGDEVVSGDIVDFHAVDRAVAGMGAIVHTAVSPSGEPSTYSVDDDAPFLVNLKGLWNVLEAARRHCVRRVVHVGSCQTMHPEGVFFGSDVRRPDGSLYAVTKRLQEEMCRQYYEAFGLRIIVLRADYIVDSRLGMDARREKLGSPGIPYRSGWVCRHDLAEACRLAVESSDLDFDVLHIVGTPEADATCNARRARELLGLEYRGALEQYRHPAASR